MIMQFARLARAHAQHVARIAADAGDASRACNLGSRRVSPASSISMAGPKFVEIDAQPKLLFQHDLAGGADASGGRCSRRPAALPTDEPSRSRRSRR